MAGRNRRYDAGNRSGTHVRSGSRYDAGMRAYDRDTRTGRPWVGGYQQAYQGGSEGIPAGSGRRWGGEPVDAGDRGRRGKRQDLWWLGYHAYDEQYRGGRYDEQYRRFHEQTRPRFSPIGGMHAAMGGEYARGRPPRPLAYDRWFSDWTRWF